VAHLNVASLQQGLYVDPEDWSPERTQFLDPIEPGASARLTWRIHGLFAGNFAIYVVVMAKDTSGAPVVSEELLVHIEKWSVMQIMDVSWVLMSIPVILGLLYIGQRSWLTQKQRKTNDEKPLMVSDREQ